MGNRKLGRMLAALGVAGMLLGTAGAASALRILGVDYSGLAGEVDPETAIPIIGGFTGFVDLNAAAEAPDGTLYTAGGTVSSPLITVDPTTFTGTAGPDIDLGSSTVSIRGMAFAPDGTLYASNQPTCTPAGCTGGPQDLWTIDTTTGVGTLVGSLGTGIQGLAFAPDGTLYGWDSLGPGLSVIDPATAVLTDVNPGVGVPAGIQGLDFTPDGTLWAVGAELTNGFSALYKVDTATGELDLVGIPAGAVLDLRGIWAIPEPGTLGMVGAGLLGLALLRGRRVAP